MALANEKFFTAILLIFILSAAWLKAGMIISSTFSGKNVGSLFSGVS